MDTLVLLTTTLLANAGGFPLDIHLSPDAAIEEVLERMKENDPFYFKDEDGNWIVIG